MPLYAAAVLIFCSMLIFNTSTNKLYFYYNGRSKNVKQKVNKGQQKRKKIHYYLNNMLDEIKQMLYNKTIEKG